MGLGEMRFYYLSLSSALLLALIYRVGGVGLHWLWRRLRWQGPLAWRMMIPGLALLLMLPLAEEFWIAWHFGKVCGAATRWVNPPLQTYTSAAEIQGHLVGYKIERFSSHEGSPVLATSYVRYVREPPWFHLDDDTLLMACDVLVR